MDAIELLTICIWLSLTCVLTCGLEDDVACLKSVKASFRYPKGVFDSWNFDNNTVGYVCSFTGVECWNPSENRVLNIRLSSMGLKGKFPLGISKCASLQSLDLSSNDLDGVIPPNISSIASFLVSLHLSSNRFSGAIPADLANCSYLNVLELDSNRLSGEIPPDLNRLSRLTTFSVANNLLFGPIPHFANATLSVDDVANNPGLCGPPLGGCRVLSKSNNGLVVGCVIGGVVVGCLIVGLALFFLSRRVSVKKEDDPKGNKWARSIKGTKKIKVSMFEGSVSKMRLSDLMRATDDFSNENIIGEGRTGAIYRARMDDGTLYMVKRLQDTQHSEKEFMSEMTTLGSIKHPDLVPLLGFCVTGRERLLVYKYMPNGTLYDRLHKLEDGVPPLEWAPRLKIAVGAARGLAWLHHSCNPRVIHRGISSKCILLDSEYEPRISDFGLARLMNPIDTHLSTFVNGEFGDLGYVAPEYSRTLVATPKGDVYSFGTVLLELVTGERPTQVTKAGEDFKGNLVEWVAELAANSKVKLAVDQSLLGKGVDHEIFQVLKVAQNCVSLNPKDRPSMFEVYQLLRAISERYRFSTEAEIALPMDTGDADNLFELIVAREEVSLQ